MLPRERRLTDTRDFGQVFRHGRGASDELLVLKARRLGSDEIRAGVSVSRKVGKAHERNRIKRRIREALRSHMTQMTPGIHLVIVAKGGARDATYASLHESLGHLLKRARLLSC